MGCQELRPEKATSSVETNVRGLGIQQEVPAQRTKGPCGTGHIPRESSAGHPGQPGNTAAETSVPGDGRPPRSIGTFLLDPRDSALRKKKREKMQNSFS